mmetsp:Transcript_143813/g.358475  ORF Transcript_143813/g.358475 Transcript_143813/m.358475 type:complete len:269 (+) Transcript_143813:1241-2047(+)
MERAHLEPEFSDRRRGHRHHGADVGYGVEQGLLHRHPHARVGRAAPGRGELCCHHRGQLCQARSGGACGPHLAPRAVPPRHPERRHAGEPEPVLPDRRGVGAVADLLERQMGADLDRRASIRVRGLPPWRHLSVQAADHGATDDASKQGILLLPVQRPGLRRSGQRRSGAGRKHPRVVPHPQHSPRAPRERVHEPRPWGDRRSPARVCPRHRSRLAPPHALDPRRCSVAARSGGSGDERRRHGRILAWRGVLRLAWLRRRGGDLRRRE